MRIRGVVLLCAAACGSVADKMPDARVDSPVMQGDVAIDSPQNIPRTAIGVDGISTFAAVPTTMTKIPYSAEVYDDANEFDTSTNRFTAKTAGDYRICATLYIVNVDFELDVFINDVRERAFAFGFTTAQGCHVVRLAAGDFADVRVYHYGTASASITDVPAWTALTIHKMPATTLVSNTTAFNAASTTFTQIPYDHDVVDDANLFDTTAKNFVAPQAGDFQFCSSIATGSFTQRAESDLFVNNARRVGVGHGLAANLGCHTLRLAASDLVDVRYYQTQVANQAVAVDPSWNWISVEPVTSHVYAGNISSFTIPAGAFAKVPYTGEIYDDAGEFDVSTNTFTAKSAGDFEVCASFDTRDAAYRTEIDIYKNGNRDKGLAYSLGATGGHCRILRLAANDQVAIYAYQESGGAVTVTVLDPLWDWLQIRKL